MTRKKRLLIGLPILVALLALVFFYSIGAFSGYRVKQELTSFAEALDSCTPFSQDYLLPAMGQTLARSVEGETENGCLANFATLGASTLRCEIPREDTAAIAADFRKQAAATPYFTLSPGYEINYDSSADMDPLMALYNSPACVVQE